MTIDYDDQGELIVRVPVSVTCPTEGCENHGITIDLDIPEGASVVCGPCGNVLETVTR